MINEYSKNIQVKTNISNNLYIKKSYGYYITTSADKNNIFKRIATKCIQRHGMHILADRHIHLKSKEEVAVHVGFCRYEYDDKEKCNGWWFYESHYDTHGVERKNIDKFIKDNDLDMSGTKVHFYEDEFDFEQARRLVGTPYGTVDIFRMALYDYLHILFDTPRERRWLIKPDCGLVCSEYFAMNQINQDIIITFSKNNNMIQPYMIQPAHIQEPIIRKHIWEIVI